jgi:sporulation protein YlmC with PRC-barrel domain
MNKARILLFASGLAILSMGTPAFTHSSELSEILAVDLIGRQVWWMEGNALGQVDSLVIDPANGRVPLIIVRDVPGLGARKIGIPYALLESDPGGLWRVNFPRALLDRFKSRKGGQTTSGEAYVRVEALGEVNGPIDPFFVAEIYQNYGVTPYWRSPEATPLERVYATDDWIGRPVVLNEGASARIQDMAVDPSGRIALLVLSNISGRQDTIAVPYGAVAWSPDRLVINVPGDKWANAPAFEGAAELGNRDYLMNVYRYYGQTPYWTHH